MLLEFGPCLSLCVLHCIASFHESHAWHIFIHVDAETEVAYEPTSEEVANPADLQGKPRSITHKFSILMFN